MPPWPPDTNYTRFLYERIITQSEKTAILNWVNNGCQQGDTSLAPSAPVYAQYQLYGTPDIELTIPVFTSNANTNDAYNCFSLPSGLAQDRWLRAYEIIPGNSSIVHHVIVNVDTVGSTTNDLSGNCFNAPGNFGLGGYAPGAAPTVFPGIAPLKAGIRIKANSKIVLQIHYPAGTAGQQDSTKIRMYFYPIGETGIRPVFVSTPLQNWTLFIPANTIQTFNAQYNLPTTLSIFAAFPHSHKVCTSVINYANNGTDTIPLIRINKWSFEWQGFYTYRNLIKIPSGYTLQSSHVYDNTTANPDNPNNPPQLVTAGTSTTDEMLFDAFMYLAYQTGDENIDIAALLQNDTLLHPLPTSTNSIPAPKIYSATYPNPFDKSIKISHRITQAAAVTVSVYNIYGSIVKKLSESFETAGHYETDWNGNNDAGEKVSPGVYFYLIRAGKTVTSGKMILMLK
ncbi:MAG: T9SS type A sorting domain-containing protein [Bacteroidia bacterium]|nr:T9SS type A sorting domain-containing protein [Bacteroidia bacterium]